MFLVTTTASISPTSSHVPSTTTIPGRSYQRLIHCFLNTIKHFLFSADEREQANYFLMLYDLSLLCNWINMISRDRCEPMTF
jgi:hypothetical protein